MSSVLFVPIHLDGLFLPNDRTFVGPTADFTRLPYFDGEREVNAEVAYVSEDVVSLPFKNESLYLKAGVHLHWALPDALTRGRATPDGQTIFPAVPNRWLVIRSLLGKKQREWIVESDYLYPEGTGQNAGSISIPYEPSQNERQPFRYVGRNMPLEAWSKQDTSARYLKHLTAIGYGEPTFSAFYANSHSVFGLHDDFNKGEGLRYDVIGWYSASTFDLQSESNDFLTEFLKQKRETLSNQRIAVPPDESTQWLIGALERELGWTIALEDLVPWYSPDNKTELKDFVAKTKADSKPSDLPSSGKFLQTIKRDLKFTVADSSSFPSAMVCYASLTFVEKTQHKVPSSVSVAVGSSGTEALSSFLAQEIDPVHKFEIEDQLEALLLSDHLEHRQLDIGFKFQEARHEKAFMAVSGGSLWTITQETHGKPTAANATDADAIRDIALPDTVAYQLNGLNLLQQEYDQSLRRIDSLRGQLFSDWYKYMLSAYPPDDSRHDFPDADKVKHYIQKKDLALLKRQIDATGTVKLQTEVASGAVTDAQAAGPTTTGSVATRLAVAIKELLQSLDFDTGPEIQDLLKYKVTSHALELLKEAKFPFALTALEPLTNEAPRDKKDFLKLVESKVRNLSAAHTTVLLRSTQALSFKLKLKPAPRFWQPNEPVVLIAGGPAEPTDRHGQDGRLRDDNLVVCHLLHDADLKKIVAQNFSVLTGKLEEIRNDAGFSSFAFNTWDQNPWNPLFLEWEVEVFPVGSSCNLHPHTAGYGHNFISDNYHLANDSVDLTLKQGRGVTKAANVYVGTSILTPHASDKLEEELERFFLEFMEPALLVNFYVTQKIPEKDRAETFLLKQFPQLRDWYLDHSDVLLQFYKDFNRTSDVKQNDEWLCKNITQYLNWSLKHINVYACFSGNGVAAPTPQDLQKDKTLAGQFIAWLKQQIYKLEPFYEELKIPREKQSDEYLRKNFEALVSWYQLRIQRDMQMVLMLQAYHKLADPHTHFLSQSLGGFNQALLMHKQMMQLPVADPLGFQDGRDFVREVNDAVGNMNRSGCEPLNDFNPVLSGVMQIKKLRLIDTFGQVLDVDCTKIIATNLMRTQTSVNALIESASDYLLTLPPRVVQPCRLNFRWLSAADNQLEMNDHPNTTTICGWVLPNHLSHSLAVFDNNGSALGSIILSTGWEKAPQSSINTPDKIKNRHLRNMVCHLHARDEAYRRDFITAIDNALENIEPENFAQHQDLAILIGSPLALVRARLEWELQGEPAIDHSWEAFRLDLTRRSRDIDGFTSIEFPIRIGEHRQLNDGVVGYWIEQGNDYENEVCYAPQSNRIEHAKIVTRAELGTNVHLALDGEPKILSMLIDPRGVVHATSGIVPTKGIDIPPDQYTKALSAIEATFFTGPVLTPSGEINLPLPNEVGYDWRWVETDGKETSKIGATNAAAEFRGQQVLREGWLKLTKAQKTS